MTQISETEHSAILSIIDRANDSTLKQLVHTYILESGVTNIQVHFDCNADGVVIRGIQFRGDSK